MTCRDCLDDKTLVSLYLHIEELKRGIKKDRKIAQRLRDRVMALNVSIEKEKLKSKKTKRQKPKKEPAKTPAIIKKSTQRMTLTDYIKAQNQRFERLGACPRVEWSADEPMFSIYAKDVIEKVLGTLSDREARIIRLRFGLDGNGPKKLEDVGRMLKITRERVRQIEATAIRKLRHPSRSQCLRDYLD